MAIALARTVLERARGLEDDRLVAMAGSDLASFLLFADEGRDEAQGLLETSLAHHRRIGDEINVATVLSNLASLEIARGNPTEARRCLTEALEIGRSLEALYQTSFAAGGLGFVALQEGNQAAALPLYREALEAAVEFGAARAILTGIEGIAFSLSSFDALRAARLLGAAQAIRARRELQLDPIEEATYARLVDIIRDDLGVEVFEREASSGARSLSLDEAATLALDLSRSGRVVADTTAGGV
jgi:tetratricopeptide (TPR) repeat protein